MPAKKPAEVRILSFLTLKMWIFRRVQTCLLIPQKNPEKAEEENDSIHCYIIHTLLIILIINSIAYHASKLINSKELYL